MSSKKSPKILWDVGTAHDLFMSLDVLHHPEEFGLRGAWAAGVRSRLPADEREILHKMHSLYFKGPLYWVSTLPEPKDVTTALNALQAMPAEERLTALVYYPGISAEAEEILNRVAAEQQWTQDDQKVIKDLYQHEKVSRKDVANFLDVWAESRTLGDPYLKALRGYYDAFFAEEEDRIQKALQDTIEQVQAQAEHLEVLELLDEISEGFRFGEDLDVSELVLIPSFWITPLVAYLKISPERMLFMFGARPQDASLVPGEVVPDTLFRTLKALADPTRLRILRYLVAEPLTPTQLARRLRLRAPTVVHHLRTMRLAGLVHLTLGSGKKVQYTARPEAIQTMINGLKDFLDDDWAEE